MSHDHIRRTPAGSPDGGKFASTGASSEADVHLFAAKPVKESTPKSQVHQWDTVPSDVTDRELEILGSPDAPLMSRLMVANTPYPGVAERASHDESPLVRAVALTGWDLPHRDARRLSSDPQVNLAMKILGTASRQEEARVFAKEAV